MIPLHLNRSPLPLPPPPPPTAIGISLSSPFLSTSPIPNHKSTTTPHLIQHPLLRLRPRGICRAHISQDAPFAIAIAASMLNSLVFPCVAASDLDEEEEEDAAITPTDARYAVMAIISFIPYFNWLSWIFAWMDTANPRYAVYAAVYLAPYLRTNLSLSPEESWLPIASIVLCIIHVQLEASIRNGDIEGFTLFNEAAKHLGLIAGSKDNHHGRRRTPEGRTPNDMNLPSGKTESRDEIRKWRVTEHSDADDKMED